MQVNQTNIQSDDYTIIITHGEVVHIGESISNQSLSIGDTHLDALGIVIGDNTVRLHIIILFCLVGINVDDDNFH